MSRISVRSLVATAFFAGSFFNSSVSAAQLQLEEKQTSNFYVAHVGSIALLSAAALAIATDPPVVLGARWHSPPTFEEGVRNNSSPLTSTVSDVTLLTGLLAPLASLYGTREGASYPNSLIVYGQATSASLLLTSLSKRVTLRERPSLESRSGSGKEEPKADDHYSFYSGHSSLSFTAGVSGSYLFSAMASDLTHRSLHWGTALALASFTAHARVRAGRHYPSDILVGAMMGTAVGIATPLLHGIRLEISEEEIASAGPNSPSPKAGCASRPRAASSRRVGRSQLFGGHLPYCDGIRSRRTEGRSARDGTYICGCPLTHGAHFARVSRLTAHHACRERLRIQHSRRGMHQTSLKWKERRVEGISSPLCSLLGNASCRSGHKLTNHCAQLRWA